MKDSNHVQNELEEIKDLLDMEDDFVDPIAEPKEGEISENLTDIDRTGIYWDYLNTDLLNVDIPTLRNKNSDTKGWLQVKGTYVNYPFVQTSNNEYYLTHSFSKTTNGAGWVFADYRNNFDELDKNTVIYAHGRFDKTMFGSLKKIFDPKWQNDPQNHFVYLSTEEENTLWQVFSIYHIPTTSDYIKIQFTNDEEFLSFAHNLLNRSIYDFHTTINESDKILTLSTCLNNEDKIVLHAKLIKSEMKF